MMHNNLFLNRLVIFVNNGLVAFDEVFHHGINIICGDNSSGKTTISQFIFYALGGAFNDWVKEAKQCKEVIAEVQMNGAILTLRREININPTTQKANAQEPIGIFWGSYIESINAPTAKWSKFNYVASENKKSFSNVFFDNLDIPTVKGENNITFHQLLRLIYVDQESPTSSLFLYEQFDTTLTRETVSDLLLGVYDQGLYDSKQRLIVAKNELDDVKREIKVIKQFIPNEFDLVPALLKIKIENKEKDISAIEDELILLKEKNKPVRYGKTTLLEFELLNNEAIIQRGTIKKLEEKLSITKYEIDDTAFFIQSLEDKIRSVKNSSATRQLLGDFSFEYCPQCLAELEETNNEHMCKLCKGELTEGTSLAQARKIEQELSFQVKESNSILGKRKKSLDELQILYDSEKIKLASIQSRVNAALKDVKSIRDEKIDRLFVEKGFLEGEILQFRTLLENAEKYQNLIERRQEFEKEIHSLEVSIDRITTTQNALKLEVNKAIEGKALYLLNNDLDRQEDFKEAKVFNIDYRNNLAFIADKDAKYSASSNFYLKTTARFALFLASLDINQMRYPRFILCDNMEDKGIEPERARNFQRIIINAAEQYDYDTYQLIYTTSYLPEELIDSEYIVGEYHTKQSPTLKNITF